MNTQFATFAGGCFWCSVAPFEELTGVEAVISGFSGGDEIAPSYEDVKSGKTGHREAVQILYDPSKVAYSDLVRKYWTTVDPTDPDGQFYDHGLPYTTAIFYNSESERNIAEESKEDLSRSGKFKRPIVTKILPFNSFFAASEEHQQFHIKNPTHYNLYRKGSGRDEFLNSSWGAE